VVFAKSTPIDSPETLICHTKTVLEGSEYLRNTYGSKILNSVPTVYRKYFWDLLSLVCKAHDLGKVQTLFQNRILQACKRPTLPLTTKNLKDIPHNIISPAFIHNHVKSFPKDLRPVIYQAIAFHHKRGKKEYLNDNAWRYVEDVIKYDISDRLEELEDMQSIFSSKFSTPSGSYLRWLRMALDEDQEDLYTILKGCFHRADHSGSAHLPIEVSPKCYSMNEVVNYLLRHNIERNNIWQTSYVNPVLDQNVILQAGTGSGKTEFALCWVGDEKAFYTLPMRTSVNAMYERLKDTYKSENIGLLHSDSAYYALSSYSLAEIKDDEQTKESLQRVDISRQLSMPLSVSTADQLFTAAFRYDGFQKIFATLAYSRLIVDEIQSYDPDIVAVILKTLVDVARIGCKFCIITATLPKMYINYLQANTEFKMPSPRFNKVPRHRIKFLSHMINHSETIDFIISLSRKNRNLLIIVNTVKIAQEIKRVLDSRNVPSNLLHSMFIYDDRDIKENCILNSQNGIWITTQVAEVSLNIDFDVIVTEISSIDSQIQRWGRVWRNRKDEYTKNEPNIYITLPPSDKGKIYDEDLVNLTHQILSNCESLTLSDVNEFELVQKVFDSDVLASSKYKHKFDMSIRMLEEYDLSNIVETKSDAQKLFRHISNITIIPSEVYYNNQEKIDQAIDNLKIQSTDRFSKLVSLKTIRLESVAVPSYYLEQIKYWFHPNSNKYDIMIADMRYSFELGIELASVPSAALI
jgi:CRISPR-associated endonuclease/helicase Cas3